VPKKAQFTHERVEYNVFLFDEPLKGSKSLKTFKISLTFRFDKLSHLSKSVHIEENSQILTVSNKKYILFITQKKSRSNPSSCCRSRNKNVTLLHYNYNVNKFKLWHQCPLLNTPPQFEFP
jgi:hypothetical protein